MNAAVKRLDVICIGRVAVDLYAQQIGARLEDVASFSKYLGGSSGNVAWYRHSGIKISHAGARRR